MLSRVGFFGATEYARRVWGFLGAQFRQRPFVPLALSFAGGILASRAWAPGWPANLLLICATIPLFLFPRLRVAATTLLLFGVGAALYSARYEILSENDLRLIIEDKPALVSVRARLLETPAIREFPARTNKTEYSYARLDVKEVLFERHWRPALGQIATTVPGVFGADFFKGRTVEAVGILERPKFPQAPGVFNFRQYLYNARIYYQLRSESTNDWQLTSHEALPLTERFQRWANLQLARGLSGRDEPLDMVRAMALGTTQSVTGEVADVFMRTGTMHIFAISGLHVACIAACILMVLRFAGMPRDTAAIILIPLIWFYTLATGWQSSAVRSALMSSFVFAGWALRRPTELLNSTAAAALLILLVEPEQLFQASFQLSFSVVAAIAVILGHSREIEPWPVRIENRILRHDPLLPPELRPRWKRIAAIPLGFVLGNFAISFASWLGSNPLTAFYFNMVTPISLLANLVAVPLSSVSLGGTLGSLLVPPLGPLFNYLSWVTMWATIASTRWLSHLPAGYFYIPKPNIWFFIAYFASVALCIFPSLRQTGLKRWAYSFTGVALLIWLCSLIPSSLSTRITLLPVRGTPLLIDAPGRSDDLLLNCSNERGAEQLLRRFLHGQGFGSIRNVALTHADADHAGGFTNVLAEFSPRAVFVPSNKSRSRVFRNALAEAEKNPVLLRKISAGEQLISWKVLHPPSDRNFSRAADNAVVLSTIIHGWPVLFLSDLGPLGAKALKESGVNLRADILITGAPPAGESIDAEMLAAIKPRLILVAHIDAPFKRTRTRDWLNAFRQGGAMVVSTAGDSAVTVELTRSECRVTSSESWFSLPR